MIRSESIRVVRNPSGFAVPERDLRARLVYTYIAYILCTGVPLPYSLSGAFPNILSSRKNETRAIEAGRWSVVEVGRFRATRVASRYERVGGSTACCPRRGRRCSETSSREEVRPARLFNRRRSGTARHGMAGRPAD